MKTTEQLKEEWGMERYVTALGIMTRKYISNQLNTYEQIKEFSEKEPDAFEVFKTYIMELADKLLDKNDTVSKDE